MPIPQRVTEVLDALREHGADDSDTLRNLLEAVLVVGRGLDLDEALQRIVDVAARLAGAQYGALGVRAQAGGLSAFVYTGITTEQRAVMGELPVGRGVLGVLIDSPHVLRIASLASHPASVGFPPHHPPMNSFLGAPVIVRGEVFGSIYLTEKQDHPTFSPRDESVIAVLAVAAGIAIDNARLFEGARIRQRWMQVMIDRGAEALAGVTTADTLARLCDDVSDLTEAAGVHLVSVTDGSVAVRSSSARASGQLPGEWGNIAEWANVTVATVLSVSENMGDLRARGVEWVTVQPVGHADAGVAALIITHRSRPQWEAEQLAGLASVGEVASLALLYAEQQRMARELEVLEDRHRIARDLHDHVIQRLFAVGMSVQSVVSANGMAAEAVPAAGMSTTGAAAPYLPRLSQVVADLDATIAQIRTSIFDLQSVPGMHDAATLRRRVLDLVAEVAAHAPVNPSVQFEGPVDTAVPDELAPHIAAVLREGMSNALRHARASHIAIRVRADEVVTVEISDDGRGIPADAQFSGLDNLTRRADDCDGTFDVTTGAHGAGTVLTWVAPLP